MSRFDQPDAPDMASAPDSNTAPERFEDDARRFMRLQVRTDAELLQRIEELESKLARAESRLDYFARELSTVRGIATDAKRQTDYAVPRMDGGA